MRIGNRIIFDEKGKILFQTGEMEIEGDTLDREPIEKLDYIDLECGVIDYSKYYIESIDVETKQPIVKEYPQPELTEEQKYIKELEEKLADAENKLINTIPELIK